MYNILRTASLELQTIENKDVVKVAGVLNKLKNYLRQLGDKEYASAVEVLRADSWMVQQVSTSLRKKIKELTEAIDDGDIDAYDTVLGEVRELTGELAIELKNLNKDVQINDPRNQADSSDNVIENSNVPEKQSLTEELPLKYTREQWDDTKQRANIFDYVAKMIRLWHPEHDVPVGQNVNKPLNSFKWFDNKDIHIKHGGSKNAKERLIDQTARLLVRETSLSYEEARNTFENEAIFDELAKRLTNAIYNGTLLHYVPATPAKEPKDKSKIWVKERQVGEMSLTVKTADFAIPVYDIMVSMTVGLTDMGAPLNGVNKLVLGYTEYSRVSAGGVPPAFRKGQTKSPQVLDLPIPELPTPEKVEADPIPEEVAESPELISPPEVKQDVPIIPEINGPVQKKRVRRKKTTALRLELLQGLLKNAGLDLTAVQKLPENFWIRFVEMSKRLGAKPEDLAKVINSESGFDPKATNVQEGKVIAKGLNQLTKKTAKALGMSDAEWKSYENVPAEEQLKYVEKFFRSVGNMTGVGNKWESATQLYVANFAPKYVRQASNPNTVLYSKQDNSDAYNKNIGLDRDKKGYITAGDLARSVTTRPLSAFIVQALEKAKMADTSLRNIDVKNTPSNDNNVDGLLTALFALDAGPVEKIVKRALEKKYLPSSNVLVTISSLSSPFDMNMKFAYSASLLLKEIIDADVSIHTDNKKIELQCTASGSQYAVASAVKALCDCVAANLELNTQQIMRYAVIPSTLSKHAKV